MQTELLYLQKMDQLTSPAQVIAMSQEDEKTKLVLNQTIFYPKGGGQPSDKGFIITDQAVFEVQSVVLEDKIVYHTGIFLKGLFDIKEQVQLNVDQELRDIHSKVHSAGHLVDYALDDLGFSLELAKAYHVPHGAYVEYKGSLDQAARDRILVSLEGMVNQFVQEDHAIKIALMENNPEKRVMFIDGHRPILCGGTHVQNTGLLHHITIRKIKNEKGNLRISYAVD